MATYLPGSNVKSDSMQTLYLMNPSYTGYADSTGSGNMVLVNPTTGVANQVGNSTTHQQQQYSTFSLPSVSTMPNPNIGNQNSSVNTQGYSWSGGNELLFLPANDMREDSQSLAARLNSISQVQETTSGIGYGVRNLSQSAFQEQMPFIPSGIALGLTAESMQPPAGAGQILSLSLSSQQSQLNQLQSYPIQHPELGIGSNAGFHDISTDGYLGKRSSQWVGGNLNSYRASPNMLGPGFQDGLISTTGSRQMPMLSSSPKVEIYTSRYLKPVQDLLNEVVSIKKGANNNSSNQVRMQSWPTSTSHTSLNQDKGLSEVSGKDGAVSGWGDEKDAVSAAPTVPAPENNAANQEQKIQGAAELSTTERQELQMKKAKLMTMLDEVDQRYKQYHHQMQIVVASFESTAGFGTAQTYTALALQTISKHFRCLKDAIKGQIRVACKALGEEDIVGQGRGETSRLRFIDQQLRQQRALQQLGMMQQHPWRPQRGLPERSVSILRAWLFEHFLHPYPKDSDKVLLARQTGLSRNQVSNWFINARVRLWKPMVEEMYAEEMKETEEAGNPDKPAEGDEDNNNKVSTRKDGGGNNESNTSRQVQISDPNADETKSVVERVSVSGSLPDNFLFQEKEGMGQVLKKARSSGEECSSFLSPSGGTTLDFKSHEFNGAEMLAKLRTEDRHLDGYGIPQGGMSREENQNIGGYSMFQMSGLNRYPSEGLAASYGSNTGVSLTLGLQHSEGLSLTGGQQQYLQGGQGQMQMVRRQDSGMNTTNYYDIQDIPQGHSGSYEALNLQDRKRFTSQILQNDFS